jgi:Trypsin-like peptidase domain
VRVNSDARRCVVFFGKPSPPDGQIRYGGTGFLLVDRDRENVPYLITCRHVARALEDDFVVRVNKRDGSSVPLPLSDVKWSYHPDKSVDLAATILPLDANVYDVCYFNFRLIQPYDREKVLAGDPVSLVGLFRLHVGTKRNVPIVHSGHIAALPDPHEKIPVQDRTTGGVIEVEAYLVEAQTLEGLSGSPVFIQQFAQIPGLMTPQGGGVAAYGDGKILGLYSAAWDARPGEILAEDKNLKDDNLRVPIGMGIVVPGERITELINDDPEFETVRRDVRQHRLARRAATTDDAFPQSADANPRHREDFTALLNAAVKKPGSKD